MAGEEQSRVQGKTTDIETFAQRNGLEVAGQVNNAHQLDLWQSDDGGMLRLKIKELKDDAGCLCTLLFTAPTDAGKQVGECLVVSPWDVGDPAKVRVLHVHGEPARNITSIDQANRFVPRGLHRGDVVVVSTAPWATRTSEGMRVLADDDVIAALKQAPDAPAATTLGKLNKNGLDRHSFIVIKV